MNDATQVQTQQVEPLIYTSKGNLLASSLAHRVEWQDNEDATVFIEEYRLGEEVVKRSVHVMSKRGLTADGSVSSLT